jgi:ABC-type Fe3+/spermidine/putrescine transport system ATPase subunit
MIMEGLEIREIQKSFGDTSLLKGISFLLARGEILAILGPSGSGKTTLLEIIAGLDQPDSGDILWDGTSLLRVPTHLRNFGLMFQEYVLFPHKNVGENIGFGLRMAGLDPGQIKLRVNQVLDLIGLPGYVGRDVSTLSGGEQQRVALARSLAPEPRLVMLDEPLGALDRAIRERLVGELREILKKACQTALYVTHDQEEAFSIADRIVILGNGKTAQIGTAREIYYQPNSPYVAQFLGMTNLLEAIARPKQGGSEIETKLGSWTVSDKHEGKGLALLRPDRIHLSPAGVQNSTSLRGNLISSTFSGSTNQILLQIDQMELKFNLTNPEDDLPEVNQALQIWFSPDEALHFYQQP